MQRYTTLRLKELKSQFNKEREIEEGKLIASMHTRGLTAHHRNILAIEYNYIEKFLNGLFETEKKALTHENSVLPENYFDNLKEEIIGMLKGEMDIIRSRVLKRFELVYARFANDIISDVDQKKGMFKDGIRNKVDILQEEIRLGMLKPSQSTSIHIEGDVGAINTGVVYGSVQGEIKKIRESVDSGIADLFDKLLETINTSDISGSTKKEQMQNVELLVQQYSQAKKERNYGLVNASLSFLSAATNLSTLWAQYGQAIMDIFK
jgi:hypothetical protein